MSPSLGYLIARRTLFGLIIVVVAVSKQINALIEDCGKVNHFQPLYNHLRCGLAYC